MKNNMSREITSGVQLVLNRHDITLEEAIGRGWVRKNHKGNYILTGKGNRVKQRESSHPSYARMGRGIFSLFDKWRK